MAGKWSGGLVSSLSGEAPPVVQEWTPVSVPGRPAAFGGEPGPVAYRTRFDDPREDERERTVLDLRGARWETRLWLNGTLLAEHDRPFVPATVEFDPEPANELVVACAAPGVEWDGDVDGFDPSYPAGVHPDVATPGIHERIAVGRRPPTFLRRLTASPTVTDDGATIEVAVEVDSADGFDGAVTLSLRPEGFQGGGSMERVGVEVAPGERAVATKTLEVRDPSLWWPRDLGPQHRYVVTAKVDGHSLSRTVGLRRVDRDEDGLLVNDTRVGARGFVRLPGTDDRADVERASDANATILRARGHVPTHEFYEACDEAGVLVWQDLPLSATDGVESASTTAGALIEEYAHHPSLATLGVREVPAEDDPFADPLGNGSLSVLRFRWRTWRGGYDRSTADDVAAELPTDLPAIPVVGPPGTGADASTLYPGWRYLDALDVDWLLDRYPTLASAVGGFGAGSLTDDAADPASVPGLDATALSRQGPDGDAASTQAYQASVVRAVAETLRRRNSGLFVLDALRDVAPGGGMGAVDVAGDPKPAYDAVASAFEPVQAVLDEPPALALPGTVGLTLCNDTAEAVDATVRWHAGDAEGEATVSAGPHSTADAGEATVPADATDLVITVDLGERTVENRYDI